MKKKGHSVAEALRHAQELGYKYCDTPHNELKVGDVIEIGLNSYRVEDIKLGFGTSEVRYSLIGKNRRTDDEYWKDTHFTDQEQRRKNKEYYEEWKARNAPCWW